MTRRLYVFTITFLLSLTLSSLVYSRPEPQKKNPAASYVAKLEKRAEALRAKGELFEADRIYRSLYFAMPGSKYSRKTKAIDKEIAESVLKSVEKMRVGSEDWMLLLTRAYEFDPKNSKIKKVFKKNGYKYYQGAWRTKDQITAYRTEDERLAGKRKSTLKLADKVRIIRDGSFRFFTDVKGGNQQLKQMIKASKGVYNGYLDTMRAFDLRFPSEGLDVVIFTHKKDYRRYTGSDGTVGLYVPSHGASYFYLGGGGDIFQTLLHELAHQFNHKVGYFGDTLPCMEEGIAEYFGYSKYGKGFTRVTPGAPNPGAIQSIRNHLKGIKGFSYLSFGQFLSADDAYDYDFYEQSWALYYYLMKSPDVRHRLIIHDYFVATREDEDASLLSVISKYGLSPVKLQRSFEAYWKAF